MEDFGEVGGRVVAVYFGDVFFRVFLDVVGEFFYFELDHFGTGVRDG